MNNTPTVEQTILMDVERALKDINPTAYVRPRIVYTKHKDARSIVFTVIFMNEFEFSIDYPNENDMQKALTVRVWRGPTGFPTKTITKEIPVHNLFDYESVTRSAVNAFMRLISFAGDAGHIVRAIATAMQASMDDEDSDGEFINNEEGSCYKFTLPPDFDYSIINQIM